MLCNIGLNMNESKTKYISENVEPGYIQRLSGKYIGKAENFNYTRMLQMALNISWKGHITMRSYMETCPKSVPKLALEG